jgi:hypothetical protein
MGGKCTVGLKTQLQIRNFLPTRDESPFLRLQSNTRKSSSVNIK